METWWEFPLDHRGRIADNTIMEAIKKSESKGRLTLGNEFAESTFIVERKKNGSILLKPAVSLVVPKEEAWFYQNQQAQKALAAGLEDAKNGKLSAIDLSKDIVLADSIDD